MKLLKNVMPTSLMGRSLLILVVPVLIVQIVTTYVFFDRHWERVVQRNASSIAGEVAMILAEVENASGAPADRAKLEDKINRIKDNLDLKVRIIQDKNIKQNQIYVRGLLWERIVSDIVEPILTDRLNKPYHLTLDFNKKRTLIEVQSSKGVIEILAPKNRIFSSSGYIYLLWVLGSALLLLMLAIIFMRNQIRPIRKLAVAADRLGRGQTLSHFKVEGAREVRQAGQAFVNMAARIRTQIEQRTLMLAGVSHDLRTPLTRLRLELSMMPVGDNESDHEQTIKAMRDDLTEMERMINGYLDFVRGGADEEASEVNLNDMIKGIVSAHKRGGASIEYKLALGEGVKGKNIKSSADDGTKNVNAIITIKTMAITRCINNIIGNALKHGDKATVTLNLSDNDYAQICIEDSGDGIPQSLYSEVFKPFYRADEARSEGHGSVGLGLSIAMDVVHAHGGRIWLSDSKDLGGLAVYMTLPW